MLRSNHAEELLSCRRLSQAADTKVQNSVQSLAVIALPWLPCLLLPLSCLHACACACVCVCVGLHCPHLLSITMPNSLFKYPRCLFSQSVHCETCVTSVFPQTSLFLHKLVCSRAHFMFAQKQISDCQQWKTTCIKHSQKWNQKNFFYWIKLKWDDEAEAQANKELAWSGQVKGKSQKTAMMN